MPYRALPPRLAPRYLQLCGGCSVEHRYAEDVSEWVCGGCALRQPALRTGDLPPLGEDTPVAGFEASGMTELVPFARSLGLEVPGISQVRVDVLGVVVDVTLEISSGVAVGVAVGCAAAAFPEITLRRETPADVRSKQSGVAREVQTGDAAFDAGVYVDSAASDGEIMTVVGCDLTRRAILTLLADFETVELGPGGVGMKSSSADPDAFDPERLARVVSATRTLASARRPIAPAARPQPPVERALGWLGLGAPLFGFIVAGICLDGFPPLHLGAVVYPLGVGGMLAILLQPLLPKIVRGRSSSGRSLRRIRVGVLWVLPPVSLAVALLLNAVLDPSVEREDELRVDEVTHDGDQGTSKVTGQIAGRSVSVDVADPRAQLRVGEVVTVWSRDGALGIRWRHRPARLSERKGQVGP